MKLSETVTLKHMQENKVRKEKWRGLTEGVRDDYTRVMIENLLENTEDYCRFLENTLTTDLSGSYFNRYVFPLITRIFPKLIAPELVSIQPMDRPDGRIFFLDYKYDKTLAPTVSGDRMDSEYYGTQGKFNCYFGTGARGEVPTGTVNGTNDDFTCLNYPIKNLVAYVDAVASTISTYDYSAGTFSLSSAPASTSAVTVDYDLDFEGQSTVNKIKLAISSDTVTAETKRLAAEWSVESEQDMRVYLGVGTDQLLVARMAEEIRAEIDGMIVDALYDNVGSNGNWSSTFASTDGYTYTEFQQTLFHSILDAANTIYKRRGVRPNWIVAPPDICNRLEKVQGFDFAPDFANGQGIIGSSGNIEKYGTIKKQFNVFIYPQAPSTKALIGYKGEDITKAGYIYAPYQPIQLTPDVWTTGFMKSKGIMSRFAKKLVNSNCYASVTIT